MSFMHKLADKLVDKVLKEKDQKEEGGHDEHSEYRHLVVQAALIAISGDRLSATSTA